MKILKKNCIVCGKEHIKASNCSVKDWKLKKYCSRACINKGRTPWNRKHDYKHKCNHCFNEFSAKNPNAKYCSRICARAKQIQPIEARRRAIETRKERYGYVQSPKTREKLRKAFLGKNSHFWRGGLTKINYRLRRSSRYITWRTTVFTRDNFTCQECLQIGGKLQAHHLKSWQSYPELRFEISNGQTLCLPCHMRTDTYGKWNKTIINL